MNDLLLGLLAYGLFYTLFLVICALVVQALPESFLGQRAMATLAWLPPFIRGEDLQNWTASTTDKIARQRLSNPPSAATAIQLVAEVEAGAMRAMLPSTDPAELTRIIACPEGGQGLVRVTAPEVFAIADYVREHLNRAEQDRILNIARENSNKLAPNPSAETDPLALQCPLQGKNGVCRAYGARPLCCRPLHAIAIARATATQTIDPGEPIEGCRHVYTVADGVKAGLIEAMKSASLDAEVYELNSALAVVLSWPDAANCWARGEDVFHPQATLSRSSPSRDCSVQAGSAP